MIHLVCGCGALVSSAPLPGARTVECRSCGRSLEIPDPAGIGLEAAPIPAPVDFGRPPVPAPAGGPPSMPVFEADERLNLYLLEREAARLQFVGRLVLVGGLAGAAVVAALPGKTPAERVVLGAGVLFGAVAGWCGLRAARASCLASVALAQRQREILRAVSRG